MNPSIYLTLMLLHATPPLPVHAPSENAPWFKSLKSHSGAECCSGHDAEVIVDADWESFNGNYRVRVNGQWHTIDRSQLVEGPNLDGRTLVWPQRNANGTVWVRCFMPGPHT